MKIQSVKDDAFKPYGRIVDGYDYKLLLERLESETEKPADGVIYEPTCKALEDTPAFAQLRDNCYGGMPIEIGYCNGTNTKLNCFEYHRDNEINIAADDAILLVAKLQDVENGIIDSSKTEAFLCPKGTAVEVYSTTLHYAPCSAKKVRDSGLPLYSQEKLTLICQISQKQIPKMLTFGQKTNGLSRTKIRQKLKPVLMSASPEKTLIFLT